MQIVKTTTKTTAVKSNSRSADITLANVVYGCLGGCINSYCYMARYNKDKVFSYFNLDDIIQSVHNWVETMPWPKKPNQVGDTYYWVDVGNASDLCLMWKYQDWKYVFTNLLLNPKLAVTFATTYPSINTKDWLSLGVEGRTRVRFSLMPQNYADVLEPNTPTIKQRIETLRSVGSEWQVHYSFAPIIYNKGWEQEYANLLQQLPNEKKHKAECIFLTLSAQQKQDLSNSIDTSFMETKNSTHGGCVYRYNWQIKNYLKRRFLKLMTTHLSNVEVRYIF